MKDLTTEIKKLEIETLDNLKLSKAKNTIRAYKSDFSDYRIQKNRYFKKLIQLYLIKL